MKANQLFWLIGLAVAGALLLVGCAPSPPEPPAVQAKQAETEEHNDGDEPQEEAAEAAPGEHADDDEHQEEAGMHAPEQHMAGMHSDIPAEAAAVLNPIAATAASLAAGERLYAANCAVCHGETGEGDGPGAAGLQTPPANLHETHVQENSDGALFYIISHGKPDTPMPAWANILDEEQRWHVVNYLRTFEEE